MSHNERGRAGAGNDPRRASAQADVVNAVRRYFQARDHLRKGICFLNAGKFEDATRKFSAAADADIHCESLPAYMAAALTGAGRHADAAEAMGRLVRQCPQDVQLRIRHALCLWKAGRAQEAIASIRQGVQENPDVAELHHQLATLLAATDTLGEAERRYEWAVILDPDHIDALVGLAMCEGARLEAGKALRHLTRAQRLRPADARINLLLSMAARATAQQGRGGAVQAAMPAPTRRDEQAIEELSRVIEAEPDFVDAFLSLPAGEMEEEVFGMLAETLQLALRRQPEHADLYYHCGRVLERLGRRREAIELTERAVRFHPKFIRALIELGKLYGRTDRLTDATTRLEEAVALGAEYPDVYLLLGNLYRDTGQMGRARWAYGKALGINKRYAAARDALEALPITEPTSTG